MRSSVLLLAASWAPLACADLLVDQVGAEVVGGGLGSPVLQSFRPAQNNVAAVEVAIIGTAALRTDVTISVFSQYSGGGLSGLDGLLATGTVADVDRGTNAYVEFDVAALVVPEETYYLLFELSDALAVGTRRSTPSPYDRGEILFGGGNFSGGDVAFRTFYDTTIPAPASLSLLALSAVVVRRRR